MISSVLTKKNHNHYHDYLRYFLFILSLGLSFNGMLNFDLFAKEKSMMTATTLKAAFPSKNPINTYDPVSIYLAHEYILLENIYSTLVEFNPQGELISGLAAKFEWVGHEAHFTMREGIKTIDGIPITAADAAFSLKRLFVLKGNTHGRLKDLLCKDAKITAVGDSCPGIRVEGNKLILIPNEKKFFLFSMLTAIDFAIIPQASVDPATLKIKDYRNTSGPYYIEKQETDGSLHLDIHPNHYHYKESIPQKVVLRPRGGPGLADSAMALLKKEIDFIPTIDRSKEDQLLNFLNSPATAKEFNLFKTMNIKLYGLSFTKKGLKKLSLKQRIGLGKVVKKAFWKIFETKAIYQETMQFFSPLGEAGLHINEINALKKLIDETPELKVGEKVGENDEELKIGFLKFMPEQAKPVVENIKASIGDFTPVFLDKFPDFADVGSENVDLYIFRTDTGFLEDISLISYTLSSGKFGFEKEEGRAWMAKYMSIEDKSKRLSFLRELHFKILSEGNVFPMFLSPFVAVSTPEWKINLSPFYANNQFWLIERSHKE